MSRGHGRIQEAIIEHLMEYSFLTADDLCPLIYKGIPRTKAHGVTIRRALNKLAAEKIIKLKPNAFSTHGRQCWMFIGTRADRTDEQERLLARKLGQAARPRLV